MTKLRRYKTNRLFHRTSFLDGIGSVINIPGNFFDFNYSNSGEEADREAIENDWGVVGDEIRKAPIPYSTGPARPMAKCVKR